MAAASKPVVPKLGPEPTLLSRKEFDVLYETLQDVLKALKSLGVDAIVTGGSLLGVIRQHSILFCDDDIDLTIIDYNGKAYEEIVKPNLQSVLGKEYLYQISPWDGGDRIRPKRMSNVFLDLFVLRKFDTLDDLRDLISVKKNGKPQTESYVKGIIDTISSCSELSLPESSDKLPLAPFWHFSTRKAIEMWAKEVYRDWELFPLNRNLKMGPVVGVCGPRMPITLLKRAFGDDCFDVYFQSISHRADNANAEHHKEVVADGDELPPLVLAGGTWESGRKTPLEDIHYLPMQPTSRALRRPTMHNKSQLMKYLEEQSTLEKQWVQEACGNGNCGETLSERPRRTIYMDGVFDLFHIGHLVAIQQCISLGDRVIIGVTGDVDAAGYKRPPIVPEAERVAIVQALEGVDNVICPCPLIVTEEFMEEHGIDLVVHGFANDADAKRQEEFFEIPAKTGRFQRISYYQGLSTTDRIANIQAQVAQEKAASVSTPPKQPETKGKPQWFSTALATASNFAAVIPYDPFPLELRQAIEHHIAKARKRRKETLGAVRQATGEAKYDVTMASFHETLIREGSLHYDVHQHPLKTELLQDFQLPKDYDLSQIHLDPDQKEKALQTLTSQPMPSSFLQTYDTFVRTVCAPHLAALYDGCDEIYYQAFPCLRMVQPHDFSIGPHADSAYGHHPCSVNYYLPLTQIGGSSSLFLESRPGAEDWHPIEGNYGYIKHFAGATNLHWTCENLTGYTRVSLDFRLIPAPLYHALQCGGSVSGGQKDVYRGTDGYYSCCRARKDENGQIVWERQGPLLQPDARMGFPWTVRNWDKIWKKKTSTRSTTAQYI
eukprot:Nitzschia sp. Nitz4//scaffold226_size53432//28383//30972//NITZ4_006701-RA/size53432-augustus-gene-0.62-mRNA-1//-1//CDS//3329542751//7732//frame0